MQKKIAALIFTLVLLTTVAPAFASASASLDLRTAIELAKKHFPETNDYKSFHSSVDSYDGRLVYHLYWGEHKDGVTRYSSHMSVQVDGNAGLVIGYNRGNDYSEQKGEFTALPTYNKEQSLNIGESFLQSLVPDQLLKVRLDEVEEPSITVGKRAWPHTYTFRFVQYVNDIPFKANSINVRVNADSGQVMDYHMTWQEQEFTAPEGIISVEQAAEAFKAHGLKLVYLRPYSYTQNSSPVLAYVLEEGRQFQIDAFTGEISKQDILYTERTMTKDMAVGEARYGEQAFTEYELQEMDLVKGLLTREQAEEKARTIMDLPAEMELRRWGLYRDYSDETLRTWFLEWSFEGEKGPELYYASANARLDASTGAMQNFYFHDKHVEPDKSTFTLTPEGAQKIAQDFLGVIAPERYKDTELTTKYELDEKNPLLYSYGFSFARNYNDVPVRGDNLYVTVRFDGRVTNFSSNWYRGDFPSAAGILSSEAISDVFLRDVGLDLEYVLRYEVSSTKKVETETHLVYWPKQMSTYNFNPHTGVRIDNAGKEIVTQVKPEYADTANHWAAADIAQLVSLGLLRLPGEQFRPDEAIKLGDLLKMLADASGWHDGDVTLPLKLAAYNDSAYANPLYFGWNSGLFGDEDGVDPESLVTREVLAFYLAKLLGHGNAAALKGIWTAPFHDFAQVADEYKGSVAITYAEGILGGASAGNFLPTQRATRAQVAVTLVRMLHMK